MTWTSPAADRGEDVIGRFYGWWRGDPLPPLAAPPGLAIAPAADAAEAAEATGMDPAVVARRLAEGHRAWLARLGGETIGWGWAATRDASIGELGLTLTLPPGNRYLWDFVTVPAWRGRRVYPALLQAIPRRDVAASRFWVGHDLPNVASGRGIVRAGFRPVGVVRRRPGGGLALAAPEGSERARAGAAILGLPLETSGPGP